MDCIKKANSFTNLLCLEGMPTIRKKKKKTRREKGDEKESLSIPQIKQKQQQGLHTYHIHSQDMYKGAVQMQ